MKRVKDKEILVGADFAGFPLKEAVVEHLKSKGWHVTDIGVRSADEENPEMFHRIGLKVGAKISEGEFERALIFCGTGMGIHIAATQGWWRAFPRRCGRLPETASTCWQWELSMWLLRWERISRTRI